MNESMEQASLLPMSTGETLAAARQARKVSLETAAAALKCDVQRLEAIESDSQGDLPPVYLRGFVMAYAQYLGLGAQAARELVADMPAADASLQAVGLPGPSRYASDRWLRAASYVLASLLVGTLAWQMTHEAVRLAQLDDSPVVPAPDAEVAAPATTHVAASIAALESLRSTPASRTGNSGAGAWAAVSRMGSEPAPGLLPGEHWLEVRASSDSWVEISGRDDSRLEQDLLRGGDVRRYRGFAPFRISLGRSSAVELLVDGIPVDLQPYTRDNVTQMRLDPAGTVDPGS
jgi:cytoskeleton protein RodZ